MPEDGSSHSSPSPGIRCEAARTSEPDWNVALSAAGFDPTRLKRTEALFTPPVFADTRAASTGSYPGREDLSVRIEAASAGKRLVAFRIVHPWTKPARMDARTPRTSEKIILALILAVVGLLLAATLLLVRYNLRKGRGDRNGAVRLSAYFLLTMLAGGLLTAHYPATLTFSAAVVALINCTILLAMALLVACTVWVLYVALEPHARRLWPTSMLGWARLLDGRLKDPLIGRDVLIGGLFGTAHYLLRTLPDLLRPGNSPFVPALTVFMTWSGMLGTLISLQAVVLAALLVFLVILLLRLIVRTDRRTAVAYLLLWGGFNAPGRWRSASVWGSR